MARNLLSLPARLDGSRGGKGSSSGQVGEHDGGALGRPQFHSPYGSTGSVDSATREAPGSDSAQPDSPFTGEQRQRETGLAARCWAAWGSIPRVLFSLSQGEHMLTQRFTSLALYLSELTRISERWTRHQIQPAAWDGLQRTVQVLGSYRTRELAHV